jgi:hypothetical protein
VLSINDRNYGSDLGPPVQANTWIHFVGVYDGNTIAFYKNGNLYGTISGGSGYNNVDESIVYDDAPSSSTDIIINGANSSEPYRAPPTTQGFGGKLNLLRMYNAALTADQVAHNYNAFRGRFGI